MRLLGGTTPMALLKNSGKIGIVSISLAVVILAVFVMAEENFGDTINFAAPQAPNIPNPGHSSVDVVVNFSTGPCTGDNTLQEAIDNGCFGSVTPPTGGGSELESCNTYSTQGWANPEARKVTLMKNGENLCSDDEGCTYRAWRVNSIDKGELMGKAAFPYRQRGDNVWLEGRNDNTGTNGNSVSTQISGNWNGVNILDDGATVKMNDGQYVNVDTPDFDPNAWVLGDNSLENYFILSICDF